MMGMKSTLAIGAALLAMCAPALAAPAAPTTISVPPPASDAAPAAPAPTYTPAHSIRIGQTVESQISPAQSACEAGNPHVVDYALAATAGQRIEARLTAEGFDTVLELGVIDGCRFISLARNDDGGGPDDGLNSRLTVRVLETRNYVLRASALADDGTGKFSLAVATLPAAATAPTPIAIAPGRTMRGTLTSASATIAQNANDDVHVESEEGDHRYDRAIAVESSRPYAFYALTGRAGQSYRIKLDSEEFDSMLDVGVDSPLGFSIVDSNDDGLGEDDGLNSRLTVTFERAGTLLIRVSPLANDMGAYTLAVENAPAQ